MTVLKGTWNREDDMRHNYKLSVQRLGRKEFAESPGITVPFIFMTQPCSVT